jgi:hypothetical protein
LAAAAASFFDDFLFRPRSGEEGWSRMTRAPLLRPLVGGGDVGSFLTKVGVDGHAVSLMKVEGADPPDLDADLDPDEEEYGVILLGVQELPCRRHTVAACGGIPRGG